MLLRLSFLCLLLAVCLPVRADLRYNLLTWPKHRLRGVNVNLDQSPPSRADLEHLAKVWKANHVRLQIFYGGVPEGVGEEGRALPDYFARKVDPVLKWCEELGLAVTLDSHGAPGNSREWSDRPLWKDFRWHEAFIRLWREIARYYRHNRAIVAYELLNEPNMPKQKAGTPSDWNRLARRLTEAIRESDKRHTIIVGAADWSNPQGFASLEPTGDANTLYTFHMYWPHRFSHQGVFPQFPGGVVYPGKIDNDLWNRESLRRVMRSARDFQKKHGLPRLYVGEFSAVIWAPGDSAYRYLKDVLAIFEENGWDWAYHAYREWKGWSLEHEAENKEHIRAVETTARLDLFRGYFERNGR